jgi:hypothetical protein
VVWRLWYFGACGVLEKETVWEMALQEEKGIEVDYWYLKSSSMSSPWFRNM